MFTTKKTSLFAGKATSGKAAERTVTTATASSNPFVNHGTKKAVQTKSGNGSVKYSTTGNDFVDQYATIAQYKAPRAYAQIDADMRKLWSQNAIMALCFIFYIRLVTRVISLFDGSKTSTTQRGAGLRHEGIMRMMWVGVNYPSTFIKNIGLFVSVGSWKDIIYMLQCDLVYNGWEGRALDWKFLGQFILAGLENPKTSELVKKYLPQIKANSACKTVEAQADNMIAKWICSLLFGSKQDATTYKKYRKLKTSGTAHAWQQLISQGKALEINFNSIAGRALAQLVSSKFITNNGLEKSYEAWISKKPVAKFTGWVYELAEKISSGMKPYQKMTVNAQFNQLVAVASKGLSDQGLRPISVLDCSGSMSSPMYIGGGQVGKTSSIQVAVSSALFFDEMIQKSSPFKNVYLSFSGDTLMCKFTGDNFVDRYLTSPRQGYGGTNFESVFRFFADFKKKNPKVAESDIPNFIVCFSDGEFNGVSGRLKTNVEQGRALLKAAGYSKEFYESFGICFVDLPNTFYSSNRQPKFETFGDVKNVYYFSGYDLSPLAFLFGTTGQAGSQLPQTAAELFDASMDQEVLRLVEL